MAKSDERESLEQEPASEPEKKDNREDGSHRDRHRKPRRSKHRTSSDEDDSSSSNDSAHERRRSRSRKRRRSRTSHKRSRRSSSESESEEESMSDSESGSESDSELERRERRRRREKEERRRKEKDRERRKRKKGKEEKRKKDKKRKKKEKETGKTGAVTDSWGKYGILRETDMWNKRPEFTAWLAEVKQVNLESLANWEEKQMFKEFMEDHNTATFPSKKYYDLEAFHRRQMEKDMKKGLKKLPVERTVFDDEEQRRVELMKERERQKEAEVEALKRSMQTGMAQAMKEQARLREEMMYQYRLGNFEAAAAIQKRLDPDAPM